MLRENMLIVLFNTPGWLPIFPGLCTGHSMVIKEVTDVLEPLITGCLFQLFFVRTGTLMLLKKQCGMNWVMQLLIDIRDLPGKCYRRTCLVMILITLI